ncbi:MAG: hypothetical protein AAF721_10745 [Myxococcota bacterium]
MVAQTRERLRWACLAAASIGLAVSCGSNVFRCDKNGDCMGAENGVCQPNGFCSFPTDDCPSGFLYGDLAPEDLAGQCVPVDDAGTGADTGGDTAGPSPGESTGGGTTVGLDDDGTSDGETGPQTSTGSESGDSSSDVATTETGVECEPDGLQNASCGEPTPHCAEGACVSCEALVDAACFSGNPATAVCNPETGGCVPCTEHDQCFTGACFFSSGLCVAPGNRLWVDREAAACDDATGTQVAPFCTITAAMEVVAAQVASDGWAVFVEGSAAPYEEDVITTPSNAPVALLGATSGPAVRLEGASNINLLVGGEAYLANLVLDGGSLAGLFINAGGDPVFVDDVTLRNYTRGFEIFDAEVTMRRIDILDNQHLGGLVGGSGSLTMTESRLELNAAGMEVQGTLHMSRTLLINNYLGGGIFVDGGTASIVNSMLALNVYDPYGTHVENGGTLDVLYSTMTDALTCDDSATVTVRNSIVYGDECEVGTFQYSALGSGEPLGGTTNVSLEDVDPATLFVDQYSDVHTLPGAVPVEGLAVWMQGDPAVDFDGDPRPNVDDSPDYAGADVP